MAGSTLVKPGHDEEGVIETTLIFEPARRLGYAAVPREDGVDLRHVGGRDGPAEGSEVFGNFGRLAKTYQRRADERVAQAPSQCELRQALAVLRCEPFQFLDGGQIARKILGV